VLAILGDLAFEHRIVGVHPHREGPVIARGDLESVGAAAVEQGKGRVLRTLSLYFEVERNGIAIDIEFAAPHAFGRKWGGGCGRCRQDHGQA